MISISGISAPLIYGYWHLLYIEHALAIWIWYHETEIRGHSLVMNKLVYCFSFPAETIVNYEMVIPKITYKDDKQVHVA